MDMKTARKTSSVVVAGGTQPLLALWLVDVTGSYLAPGGVLMVLAVLSLVALRWTPETAFDDQA